MRRLAETLVQRTRKGVFPASEDTNSSKTAHSDPTEIVQSHLRSGQFARTDGLDDYDTDFSVSAPAAGSEAEPVYRPSEEQSEEMPVEEAEASDSEHVPEDGVDLSSPSRSEKEQAIPCEMVLSRGRTLIVGGNETALREHADRLSGELDCILLLTGTREEIPRLDWSGGHACIYCPEVRIRGVFGAFRPTMSYSGEMRDLCELALGESRVFDLVLDLSSEGVFATYRPPLGYYWPGQPDALEAALNELPGMQGRFEKQHFIRIAQEACAHGHAGVRGCSRCIEVCPYGALGAGKETPVADHLLCQGCLACVSACPTGAMEPLLQGRRELLARMEEAIARCGDEGAAPVLFPHPEESEPGEAFERVRKRMPAIPVPVEAPGLLGTECLLAALAMGAAGVVVSTEGPEGEVLESQVRWARTILRALGCSPARVQLAAGDSRYEQSPLSQPAALSGMKDISARDKRAMLSRAVQGLGFEEGEHWEVWEVPSDACFGAVSLRGELCTLCMACAGACPTRALIPGGEEEPGMRFTESRCVQCGLCAEICPEQALTLQPRLSIEHLESESSVWLHREEPEKCRICGKPFASAGMLEKIRSSLRQRRGEDEPEWLTMCGECRVRTLFQDPEDSP